jgi:hypothetical protein
MVTRSFYAIAIAAVIVPGVCAEEPTIKPKDGLVLDSYAQLDTNPTVRDPRACKSTSCLQIIIHTTKQIALNTRPRSSVVFDFIGPLRSGRHRMA